MSPPPQRFEGVATESATQVEDSHSRTQIKTFVVDGEHGSGRAGCRRGGVEIEQDPVLLDRALRGVAPAPLIDDPLTTGGADARSPRNGRFIEIIGTYQPRQDPSVITLEGDRAVHYLNHGAQPTEAVAKILAIQGVERKGTEWIAPEPPAEPETPTETKATAE